MRARIISTISPTHFMVDISPILNFILKRFSTAWIILICSRLSQPSISFAVVSGYILVKNVGEDAVKLNVYVFCSHIYFLSFSG